MPIIVLGHKSLRQPSRAAATAGKGANTLPEWQSGGKRLYMQHISTNVNSISRQWPLSAHQECWRAPSIIPISIFMKMSRLSRGGTRQMCTTAQGFNAREPSWYANVESKTFKGSSQYPDTSSMLALQCTILSFN